jgi:hypothetical protein
MAVYVGIATAAVAIIVGIPTLVLTVALFRVSELGADVRAITPRIDQTYSRIDQQTNEIGLIRGDLQSATAKITAAADRSVELSNRLNGMADKPSNPRCAAPAFMRVWRDKVATCKL